MLVHLCTSFFRFENHPAWFIVIELNMVKNFNEIAIVEKTTENLIINHVAQKVTLLDLEAKHVSSSLGVYFI